MPLITTRIFLTVGVGVTVGVNTAYQQLAHSPGVMLSKKKRTSFPELDESGDVINNSDNFVICRKVAGLSSSASPQI